MIITKKIELFGVTENPAMVDKKEIVKQLKDRQKKLHDTHDDDAYRVGLIELMNLINNNPYTNKILRDLENKDEVDRPASAEELAISSLTPINDLIADFDSCFVGYLNRIEDSGWNSQRYKRITERYVDPLITFLCYTINNNKGGVGLGYEVIDAGNRREGIKKLSDALKSLEGYIRICDPYIDDSSLMYFTRIEIELGTVHRIRVLTDQRKLSMDVAKAFYTHCKICGVQFELRYFEPQTSPLHDRYILSDNDSYKMGISPNGVGNKESDMELMDKQKKKLWDCKFKLNWDKAYPVELK
jgi:hypothetical protein